MMAISADCKSALNLFLVLVLNIMKSVRDLKYIYISKSVRIERIDFTTLQYCLEISRVLKHTVWFTSCLDVQ